MEENTMQEQPIAELHTAQDYETHKAHWLATNRGDTWGLSILFLVIAAGCAVGQILNADDDMTFAALGALAFVGGFLYLMLHIWLSLRQIKKKLRKIDFTQCYDIHRFYQDCIGYEGRDENGQGKSTINYNFFAGAREYPAFFTLTILTFPYAASVFSKREMPVHEQEALRTLFAEKFGKKFKQYKR